MNKKEGVSEGETPSFISKSWKCCSQTPNKI